MTTLNSIISGQAPTQIYRLTSDIAPTELAASLQQQTAELFYLDGIKMQSKTQLMQELSIVLDFPDYFGGNWDALADCLSDLGWLGQDSSHCVLLFDHWEQCASPNLVEILQEAMDDWNTTKSLVYVLLRTSSPGEYVQKLLSVS